MNFIIIPSDNFYEQAEKLSSKASKILNNKIELLRINPFRNKNLKGYKRLFRIRFKDLNKEKRAIYFVDKNYVKMVCILDRDKDYRDLEKFV